MLFIIKEEHKLRVYDMALWGIVGPRREKNDRDWWKLSCDEFHNL